MAVNRCLSLAGKFAPEAEQELVGTGMIKISLTGSQLAACDNENMSEGSRTLIPVDTIAWLADQVDDAFQQNRNMMLLLRQYSDDLDAEHLRSAKLRVQLDEADNTIILLRKKLIEYQGRLERLRKGLPETDPERPPEKLPKTTGQLVDPGEPKVRIA